MEQSRIEILFIPHKFIVICECRLPESSNILSFAKVDYRMSPNYFWNLFLSLHSFIHLFIRSLVLSSFWQLWIELLLYTNHSARMARCSFRFQNLRTVSEVKHPIGKNPHVWLNSGPVIVISHQIEHFSSQPSSQSALFKSEVQIYQGVCSPYNTNWRVGDLAIILSIWYL